MDETFALDRASYTYPGGQPGLTDATLRIRAGEQVAILGANASGKSTLLRLLDALIFSTSGKVSAFGRELSEASTDGTAFGRFLRQQVAFLFQNVEAQLFCATVEEELGFGPRHLGVPEDKIVERIGQICNMFRLGEIRRRSVQSLSGGEKRRVGLAAVLAVGPSVVLLDEPTAGLDPRNRALLVDALLDLADAGKTLVVATHDLELASEVASRAVVLGEDHTIVADGDIGPIIADSELLAEVNLVHLHSHRHWRVLHAHPHYHSGPHEHEHDPGQQE